MTALADLPPFNDEVRAELVLTQRRLHGCAILAVRGEIDIATVEQLERTGTRLLASADGRLVLDLSQTTLSKPSRTVSAHRVRRPR